MSEQRILSLEDHLAIARKLHQGSDGRVGLWPMFRLVRWVDERMGLGTKEKGEEIAHLVEQAREETGLDGELTGEAISFIALAEHLIDLLPVVEEAVRKVRQA